MLDKLRFEPIGKFPPETFARWLIDKDRLARLKPAMRVAFFERGDYSAVIFRHGDNRGEPYEVVLLGPGGPIPHLGLTAASVKELLSAL